MRSRWTGFLVALAVMLVALGLGWNAYNTAVERHKKDISLYLQEHAQLVRHYLDVMEIGVDVVAHNHAVVSLLSGGELLKGDLRGISKTQARVLVDNLLTSLKESYGVRTAFLLDSKGNCVAATYAPAIGRNYSFRPYFRDAMKTGTGIYFAYGITTRKTGLYVAKRVEAKGKHLGVVAVMTNPDAVLRGILRRGVLKIGSLEDLRGGKIFVVLATKDGVLFSGGGMWSLSPLRGWLREELRRSRQFPPDKIVSLGFPPGTWELLREEGVLTERVEGRSYMLFSSPLEGNRLYLVAVLSPQAVMMTMGSFLTPVRMLLGGFFIAMFVIGLLGFAVQRESVRLDEAQVILEEERKRLRRMTEKYSGVIENTSQGFFEVDVNTGIIVEVNPAFCSMLSMDAEELLGITPFELVAERDKFVLQEASREIEDRGRCDCHVRLVSKSGEETPVLINGTLIRDEKGHPVYQFAFVIDRREEEKRLLQIKLLSSVVEQAPSSVVVTNVKGDIQYVNPAFTKITGYTKEEAIGQNPRVLKSGYHSPEFYEELWLTILSGHTWRGRFYNKRKDGTCFWEHAIIAPILNEDGIITHFMAIKEDITETVKLEKALEEKTKELEIIVDNMGVGLIYVKNGVVERVNRIIEEIFMVSEKEMVGGRVKRVIEPFMDPGLGDLLYQRLRENGFVSEEFKITRRDGSYVWVSAHGTILQRTEGEERSIWIVEDITYRRRMEEELVEEKKRAEEANRAKSQFLANMSHEIRTPMNAIIGMSRLVLDTPLNPEQEHYVRTVLNSAEALLSLLNDILDFSKIEAGELPISERPFNLCALVNEVREVFYFEAERKGLRLTASCKLDPDQFFLSDPTRIRQVLVNLVGNALKFTERGHVAIKVSPKCEGETTCEVLFEVEDTGIGIPKDRLPVIFERFVQADDSVVRRYGGTGLGLAISKAIVELLGGRIGVRSEVGKGSVFWFTIPMRKVAAVGEKAETDRSQRDFVPVGLDILLVEDNDVNRELARLVLRDGGHSVVEAENGVEALRWLSKRDFDVVFMDVQMPEMDGITATTIIRALERGEKVEVPLLSTQEMKRLRDRLKGKHTVIVSMTAHALSGDRDMCLKAGMDAYVSKPFRPEDLSNVFKEVGVVGRGSGKKGKEVSEVGSSRLVESGRGRDTHLSPVPLEEVRRHIAEVYGMDGAGLEEFLKLSANTVRENLEGLRNAVERRDFEAVARLAHTLKGALAALGMGAASELAFEMEKAAKEDRSTYPFDQALRGLEICCGDLLVKEQGATG